MAGGKPEGSHVQAACKVQPNMLHKSYVRTAAYRVAAWAGEVRSTISKIIKCLNDVMKMLCSWHEASSTP